MYNLSLANYQRVLDTFSVGRIIWFRPLPPVHFCLKRQQVHLMRVMLYTIQGLFLLVFAQDEQIHPIWSMLEHQRYERLLKQAVGLVNARSISQQCQTTVVYTVHKFHHRFSLFLL